MCYKKSSLTLAYASGVHRCPCCNVQLVWKANIDNLQRNLATVDHIIPKSIGGGNVVENMYIMCRDCNCKRDNKCFVKFVTSRGVSKIEAETIYKKAHVASVRNTIMLLMNQVANQADRRKYKKHIQNIVQSYVRYFGDYLPEFDLLPRDVCK